MVFATTRSDAPVASGNINAPAPNTQAENSLFEAKAAFAPPPRFRQPSRRASIYIKTDQEALHDGGQNPVANIDDLLLTPRLSRRDTFLKNQEKNILSVSQERTQSTDRTLSSSGASGVRQSSEPRTPISPSETRNMWRRQTSPIRHTATDLLPLSMRPKRRDERLADKRPFKPRIRNELSFELSKAIAAEETRLETLASQYLAAEKSFDAGALEALRPQIEEQSKRVDTAYGLHAAARVDRAQKPHHPDHFATPEFTDRS